MLEARLSNESSAGGNYITSTNGVTTGQLQTP